MDVDEYLALTVSGMAECSRQMREKGLDPKQIQSIMGDGIICGIAGVDEEAMPSHHILIIWIQEPRRMKC